ncbi:BCCT family transporter [Brucella pituitosa]|uniref:BCCT family transporter n=1 Tax=Brucella pituitosa TaxID=571256 RepID=UPI003C784620
MFKFFEYLPLTGLTSTLAILLVAIFFVTSSDSGSLVVDSIAAGGETETTTAQRVFWCALEGIVAALLLLAGGLGALQSATIASALPFCIVILALVWALFKGMRADLAQQIASTGASYFPSIQPATGMTWQRRLSLILHAPTQQEVARFINGTVREALAAVADELSRRQRASEVIEDKSGGITLKSPAEGVRDFVYGVSPVSHRLPAFSATAAGKPELRYEARTYFSSGGRGYDVMGMSRDQIIADVLFQFERYLALIHAPEVQLMQSAPEHSAEI